MKKAEHGTRTCYLYGCRCDGCKAANATYIAEWRRARSPEQRAEEKRQERLREKAARIVARRHHREYRRVLAELRGEAS